MRRRDFIAMLGSGVAASSSCAVWAQQPGRVYRLGSLRGSPRNAAYWVALFEELRRLGFIEGQNLKDDLQGYELRPEQLDEHAAALVRAGVDVIVAAGESQVRAAQRATAEIPILALTDDMVGAGFVLSLRKPGGNTTGVTILAPELDGKRQEILIEAMPGIRRIAGLADTNATTSHLQALEDSARSQGVELSIHRVARREEIEPAIDAAKASGAEALNVMASALLNNNRVIIFDRARSLRLPAIYQWPEMVDEGALIGYGPSLVQLCRDILSRQLASLLRGTKPREVPVEQPTKFELALNLKAAKALGIEMPGSLLARADEVIE